MPFERKGFFPILVGEVSWSVPTLSRGGVLCPKPILGMYARACRDHHQAQWHFEGVAVNFVVRAAAKRLGHIIVEGCRDYGAARCKFDVVMAWSVDRGLAGPYRTL